MTTDPDAWTRKQNGGYWANPDQLAPPDIAAIERPAGIPPELWQHLLKSDATAVDETPTRPSLADWLLTTAQLADLPAPSWLIDGLLPDLGLTIIYGPSGAGKSFLTVAMTLSLETGEPFLGHLIRNKVRTLYIIGEGSNGTYRRIDAWRTHHQLPDAGESERWLKRAANLSDYGHVAELIELINTNDVGLLVADTFAKCTVGVEENSAKEVGMVVDNVDRIMRETGCAVLLVHHSGMDISRGSRGSTALKGAADAELEVTAGRLTVRKMKDAVEEPPTRWKLEPAADSAVPVVDTAASDTLPASAVAVLEALENLCVTDGHTVGSGEWKAAADVPDPSFYRARAGLIKLHHVVQDGVERQARYRPARQSQTEMEEF